MIRCPTRAESGEALTLCDRCGQVCTIRSVVWRGRGVSAYRLCRTCAFGPREASL